MSSSTRDEFRVDVRRVLASRVNNRCSNPDCRASTSGPTQDPARALNIGVAAHITAAASGGPRFDLTLTPEQRSSAENGIWLCQNCAKLIDNDVQTFTKIILHEWKAKAEAHALDLVGKTVPSHPSVSVKCARVLFVETRLILPTAESDLVRISFGLMNVGDIDAVVTIRDHTYFFSTDPQQTVFAYISAPAEEMLIRAIPNAIWHAEMRFDFRLSREKLEILGSGKARLFFYARGEYRDTTGQSYPLPFAEMYDAILPGNLIAPPKAIIFE